MRQVLRVTALYEASPSSLVIPHCFFISLPAFPQQASLLPVFTASHPTPTLSDLAAQLHHITSLVKCSSMAPMFFPSSWPLIIRSHLLFCLISHYTPVGSGWTNCSLNLWPFAFIRVTLLPKMPLLWLHMSKSCCLPNTAPGCLLGAGSHDAPIKNNPSLSNFQTPAAIMGLTGD